jgi:hypothetical protein
MVKDAVAPVGVPAAVMVGLDADDEWLPAILQATELRPVVDAKANATLDSAATATAPVGADPLTVNAALAIS